MSFIGHRHGRGIDAQVALVFRADTRSPRLHLNLTRTRKILFTAIPAAWLAVALLVTGAPPAEPAELSSARSPATNIRSTLVQQRGRSLVLVANTRVPINLTRLNRFPSGERSADPYLCFQLGPDNRRNLRKICLGGRLQGRRMVGLTLTNAAGKTVSTHAVDARIKRPTRTRMVLTVAAADLGLAPGTYRWNLSAHWRGAACAPRWTAKGCFEAVPATGRPSLLEVKPTRPVGCTTGGGGLVRHGPRGGKLIALTLDDGPGPHTAAFLDVLKAKQVPGTFFVLGQQVAAYPSLARRIVREGHEIANHSWKHDLYPGATDLARTSTTIKSVTGFKPCSFRPPGGAQNASVVAGAAQSGMKTILWDVDPFDWRLPGSDSIRRIVVSDARNGSIILSHDGGGNREQTLAALPRIIDGLRARGYRFTTVTELLGGRIQFRTG